MRDVHGTVRELLEHLQQIQDHAKQLGDRHETNNETVPTYLIEVIRRNGVAADLVKQFTNTVADDSSRVYEISEQWDNVLTQLIENEKHIFAIKI